MLCILRLVKIYIAAELAIQNHRLAIPIGRFPHEGWLDFWVKLLSQTRDSFVMKLHKVIWKPFALYFRLPCVIIMAVMDQMQNLGPEVESCL